MDKRYSWMPRANVPVREQHLVLAFRQTRVRVAKVPLGALQVTRAAGAAGLGALHAARGASAPVFSVSYQAKAANGAMRMFNRNEDMRPRGDKGKSVHSRSIRDRKNMEVMLRAVNKRLGKM